MKLLLQKWFWAVVLAILLIAAGTTLLIIGRFPESLTWERIASGAAVVMSYAFGARDAARRRAQ